MGEYEQLEEPRFAIGGLTSGNEWVSRNAEERLAQGKLEAGQIRFNVAANQNLRKDIEDALARRNAENPNTKPQPRRKDVLMSEDLPLFGAIGLPNIKVVCDPAHLRKINDEHYLTVEQIVDLPNRYNNPAVVFRDGKTAFVILTDMVAPNKVGADRSVMVRLTEQVKKNGERLFLASAYAREAEKEAEYIRLVNTPGAAVYFNKGKVAALKLEQGTKSTLQTLADRDNVITPEGLTKNSIPYSGAKSQAESFKFSRPIERRKDLIALHNLSAEKLKGADELGGFAMPSVAITKDTIGHGEFGEVSLLLRDRSIDPRQNGRNMIYSGDAYTPTSPSVQYHVKDGKAVERLEKKIADDPRGTAEIWEVAAPEPMRHLTKYTAYVRKGDGRIWGLKGEAECANYLEARAKLFEVKADLEIIMRYHMDSRTSPDHFAVRFANATSPSRGTLALRAEPGPPTARVTLFALDEANLPK